MTYDELKGKTSAELKDMITGIKREVFNLRFQKAQGETVDQRRPNALRKDIARVMTRLSEMKNPEAAQAAPKKAATKEAAPKKSAKKKTA